MTVDNAVGLAFIIWGVLAIGLGTLSYLIRRDRK